MNSENKLKIWQLVSISALVFLFYNIMNYIDGDLCINKLALYTLIIPLLGMSMFKLIDGDKGD